MAFGSILLLNGIFFMYLVLAVVAIVFMGAGLVVTLVFAMGSKKRAAQGKRLGYKKAIPIVLFAIGLVPAIVVFATIAGLSAGAERLQAQDEANDRAFACVDSHDMEGLLAVLDDNPDIAVDDYANRDNMAYGESLLHRAIRDNDQKMVDALLDRGAHPSDELLLFACNYTDEDSPYSESFLEQGYDACNPQIVNALLDAGAEAGRPRARMPLALNYFVTAMCGNGIDDSDIDIIEKMLRQGARPDAVDGNGKRAIDVFNETLQESWAQKAAGQADQVERVRSLLTPQE